MVSKTKIPCYCILCVGSNGYISQVPPSLPANKTLQPIRMKKVEEFCLEMKDPLPFSLEGVGEEKITSEVQSNRSETRTQSKGTDPPSYDDAMNNNKSFQEQVDNELAQELQEKLNSD